MFKIEKYTETNGKYFIEVHCQFIKSEVLIESKWCESKTDAMRFFNYIAIEFLQGQIGEFTKIIDVIKPFYFDKTSVPFLLHEKNWRYSYYPFKVDFLGILSNSMFQPGAYAQSVIRNEYLFRNLIPSLVALGKVEMEFIVKEIIYCAEQIVITLNKMKAHNYLNPLKKTA